MPDPTTPALIATYSAALVLFVIAALIRWRKNALQLPSPEASPPVDPQAEPSAGIAPPPVPQGVPTWCYRKLDFIWAGLIVLIFLSLSLGNASVDADKIQYTPQVILSSIFFHLFLTIVTIAAIVWRIRLTDWLGLRWKNWPWVFLIAPATVGAMWLIFGGLQAAGYMQWIESLGVEAIQDSVKVLQSTKDPVVLALMAVAAVLVAPVCEEIVFRGYLFPVAKKYAGTWVAAISTGLIFSAAHGSLVALLPLSIFGIALAIIHEKTRSIWAPIAIHFCFNGATVTIQFIVRKYPHLIEQATQ